MKERDMKKLIAARNADVFDKIIVTRDASQLAFNQGAPRSKFATIGHF